MSDEHGPFASNEEAMQGHPIPSAIPSAWATNAKVAEAMAFLQANPDLLDDEDIITALGSEVPDALTLLDAFACAKQNAEDQAEAMRDRAARLEMRADDIEAQAVRLKSQIVNMLSSWGLQRRATPAGLVSLKRQPPPLLITDETMIPDHYMTEKTTRSPNRRAIREALTAGEEVAGAILGNPGLGLQVK